MKTDRFLTAIIAGIGILAVLALVLFFTRRENTPSVPDGTPEGAVLAYVNAIQNREWETAYDYLADQENKPGLDRFRQVALSEQIGERSSGVEIRSVEVNGDRADVELAVVNVSGGLFSDVYRNTGVAVLIRQGGGWKISEMPYPFWSYNWYQPESVPLKP
jgi:hypothetical protein